MLKFENKFLELFQELVSKFTGTGGTGSNISFEGILEQINSISFLVVF